MLAVGATAVLLMIGGTGAEASQEPTTGEPVAGQETEATEPGVTADTLLIDSIPADPGESARRATGTLRQLGRDFYNSLPAIGIAIGLVLLAALLAKLLGVALRAMLSSWERAQAAAALVSILIWLLALGAALSVIAGDARALVGSVGLFGLALSWALQTPIESFTGWLLNSFRSYYRIGDRIAVGDVFGDVARIDFLTTTVFEAGGPDKNVQAAQSTGAMVTFPNSEVLRSNIVNYTRDFPYVWDELTVGVTNESDVTLAVRVVGETARAVVGERMQEAATSYAAMLERAHLGWDVATLPEVYVSPRDSWTDLTVRYLVPAREMRKWSSELLLAVNRALSDPDVAPEVRSSYPRTQVQPIPAPGWTQGQEQREDEPDREEL